MKYISIDAVTEIIRRKGLQAAESWDYDAVVVCGEIIEEIEGLDYVELSEKTEDSV